MEKWEYKQITTILTPDKGDFSEWNEDFTKLPLPVDLLSKFQELGAQGWELVGGCSTLDQSYAYYLKRPKQ